MKSSVLFKRLQTPDDIYCWVGKSASRHSYRTGLYNAVALDEAVSVAILCQLIAVFTVTHNYSLDFS